MTRLVVDCPKNAGDDTSAIFPREMLDNPAEYKKEWLFDSDDGLLLFNTENEAAIAQRKYRLEKGFNPETGAKETRS